MKKRFFAGLLACLMVVGLLPLSMLLKPVSAKAYTENGNVHVLKSENMKAFSKTYKDYQKFTDENVDEYFSFYASKNTKVDKTEAKWEGENEYKSSQRLNFGGKAEVKKTGKKNVVVFKTSTSANVKIWWVPKNDNDSIIVYNNETYEKNTVGSEEAANTPCVTDIQIKKSGEYSLGASKGAIYIYKIEVTEESKYNVTVVDSATTETTGKVNSKSEGETFTLKAADPTNFLYWVNSYGRIVSRDAEYSFPVYYSDTYTAVYKSAETVVKYMTAYDQVLSEVKLSSLIKTDGTVDETVIPSNPVRYGYTFRKWSKTAGEIQAEATAGEKSIEVKPEYTLDTTTYDVTINGVTEKNQPVNKFITVKSSLGDKFAYWSDSKGNKLSYNSTYSFFVNDNVEIKEVSTNDGDKVEAEGIVTFVKQTTVNGEAVIIFEYTVPEDCTIQFAGVLADSLEDNLTMEKAKFVGGKGTSSKTFRYTLTKGSSGTYKVKPVLKYTNKNNELKEAGSNKVYTL